MELSSLVKGFCRIIALLVNIKATAAYIGAYNTNPIPIPVTSKVDDDAIDQTVYPFTSCYGQSHDDAVHYDKTALADQCNGR